jgi:trimeric autotransporter adhesin
MKFCCFLLALLTVTSHHVVAASDDDNWETFPLPKGLNGAVTRLLPVGAKLYAAGVFTEADDQPAQGVAAWDGSHWSPVGDGLTGFVYALASDGKNLFVGGEFTIPTIAATNLAMWDGSRWKSLGAIAKHTGPFYSCGSRNPAIFALTYHDQKLFAGGAFNMIGGIAATNIAVFDGKRWSSLDNGIGGTCDENGLGEVYCIAAAGRKIYAGGFFHRAGTTTATNIAVWDGLRWSSLGPGLSGGFYGRLNFFESAEGAVLYSGTVYDIRVRGNEVIAGGDVGMAGTNLVGNLARWDGSTWSAIGGGVSSSSERDPPIVTQILFNTGDLIVAGWFDHAGGVAAEHIARWDGKHWHPLGKGLSAQSSALASWHGDLFVGGDFGVAGNVQAPFVARWDNSEWSALHPASTAGVVGDIRAFAATEQQVLAVGSINSVGDLPVHNSAFWDGQRWKPGGGLPSQFANYFSAAVVGSDFYVGGSFQIEKSGATNLARFGAGSWHALPGVPAAITDVFFNIGLAGSAENLYVARPQSVFRWDGVNWSQLGDSFFAGSLLNAIAVREPFVAVGGFLNETGNQTSNAALWDGLSWAPLLGLPPTAHPYALTFAGDSLYALAYENATEESLLLRWKSAWTVLDRTSGFHFHCMSGDDRNLYVSGTFNEIGGVAAKNIARFDGTNWFCLGRGLDVPANAIIVSGSRLICGGQFTRAGGKPSYHFAIWEQPAE